MIIKKLVKIFVLKNNFKSYNIKILVKEFFIMEKKSTMELKKRMTKKDTTISKIYWRYYSGEGNLICSQKDNLLKMKEEKENDFHKFLEMQKKTLSLKSEDYFFNIKETEEDSGLKKDLRILIKSELKDESLVTPLFEKIKEAYLKDNGTNFVITICFDTYDVMTKTTDGFKVDESEEVYSYIICSICPVSLSKASLGYIESDNKISSRIQDFIVNPPEVGFVFPTFVERSSDDRMLAYFCKNPKKPYTNLLESLDINYVKKEDTTSTIETINEISKQINPIEEVVIEDNIRNENVEDINEKIDIIEETPSISNIKKIETIEKEDLIEENIDSFKEENILPNLNKEGKNVDFYEEIEKRISNEKDILEEASVPIKTSTSLIIENSEKIMENSENFDAEKVNFASKNEVLNEIEENKSLNVEELLKKINMLLEDSNKATYQVIDGKKYLIIPVE